LSTRTALIKALCGARAERIVPPGAVLSVG